MKRTRQRVDINLTELNQVLDHAVEAPLSRADCQKLKSTLHTLVELIALLKYGGGLPFNRLENLQQSLGIPLPAATQWELVKEFAEPMQPAGNELIRQGAQGGVLHNDDTGMRVLRLIRDFR